jgi:hypothetical protein
MSDKHAREVRFTRISLICLWLFEVVVLLPWTIYTADLILITLQCYVIYLLYMVHRHLRALTAKHGEPGFIK